MKTTTVLGLLLACVLAAPASALCFPHLVLVAHPAYTSAVLHTVDPAYTLTPVNVLTFPQTGMSYSVYQMGNLPICFGAGAPVYAVTGPVNYAGTPTTSTYTGTLTRGPYTLIP